MKLIKSNFSSLFSFYKKTMITRNENTGKYKMKNLFLIPMFPVFIVLILIKIIFISLFSLYKKTKITRNENTEKYKMTNLFLTLLFPVFIVLMSELNQGTYPSKLVMFIVEKPTVMLFNIAVASAIFATLCMIFKRVWRAVTIQSFVYFALSITELFKYGTNGNHLILTDMKLLKSAKSLTSFAYIKITPILVLYTCIVLAYIILAFWFNPQVKMKLTRRIAPAITCAGAVASMFFVPSVSTSVYSFFDVDTTSADNVFLLNEKFDNNSFLAFLVETASENISNKLKTPENYSQEVIDDYLDIPVQAEVSDFKSPNVIVVMSEACADFRVFDELNLNTDAYYGFDKLKDEGYSGKLIVPTFASYTVRTEFELLFGLPVKSLNDPNMPQRMLAERDQSTIVRYYKGLGYNTAYVHPFLSSFYSRSRLYKYFGFDQLLFDDSLTVPVEYNGSYIKDSVVFDQLEKLIKESDKPLYVHTTTMQNHQPYNTGIYDNELDNYLANIKLTSDALVKLTDNLKKLDEPTLLFVVGDHFPSFKDEGSVYDQLGINSNTCDVVFEQNYYMWSNYGQDFSDMPDEMFSAFYVPYVILDLLNAPKDSFVQAMLDKMQTLPIYSTQYDTSLPDDSELDVLTYDRIIGENISGD
mgnify:CR=1 FL=1